MQDVTLQTIKQIEREINIDLAPANEESGQASFGPELEVMFQDNNQIAGELGVHQTGNSAETHEVGEPDPEETADELGVHPTDFWGDEAETHQAPEPVKEETPESFEVLRTEAHVESTKDECALDTKASQAIYKVQMHQEPWASIVTTLSLWADELWMLICEADDTTEPRPAITFSIDRGSKSLGRYYATRNAMGLLHVLSLNPTQLEQAQQIDAALTLYRELLRCYENVRGKAPKSAKNGYYSRWLCGLSGKLGVTFDESGKHEPNPDGQFGQWSLSKSLTNQPLVQEPGALRPKPPKRVAWVCACDDDHATQVMVATGKSLSAKCTSCDTLFQRK